MKPIFWMLLGCSLVAALDVTAAPELFRTSSHNFLGYRDGTLFTKADCGLPANPVLQRWPSAGGPVAGVFSQATSSCTNLGNHLRSQVALRNELFYVLDGAGNVKRIFADVDGYFIIHHVATTPDPSKVSINGPLAVVSGYVFWTEEHGFELTTQSKVFRAPIDGRGTAELVADFTTRSGAHGALKLHAHNKDLVTVQTDGEELIQLWRVFLSLPPPGAWVWQETLVSANVTASATHEDRLYWVERSADSRGLFFRSAPASDPASITTHHLAFQTTPHSARELAVDDVNLYYQDLTAGDGPIVRKPLAGGDAEEITSPLGYQARFLHTDGRHLFWSRDDTSIMRLPVNAAAVTRDLTAEGIEVVQAVQNPNNENPLVLGKPTFVRFFARLNSSDGASQITLWPGALLYGFKDGVPLPGSPLRPERRAPIPAAAPNRLTLTNNFLFRLPDEWTRQGAITLRGVVNPGRIVRETDYFNNTREVTADFLPKAPVCLTLFPIRTIIGTIRGYDPGFQEMFDYLEVLLPGSDLRLSWRGDVLEEKDGVFGGYGPYEVSRSDDDGDRILRKLRRKKINDPLSPCGSVNGFTHYSGLLPVPHPSPPKWSGKALVGRRRVGGELNRRPSSIVFAPISINAFGYPIAASTYAQELAHNLGRRHVDCNDPKNVDHGYPYDPCTLSSSAAGYLGFDPIRRQILPANVAKDFMSYMDPKWVSDYTWKALLDNDAIENLPRGGGARVAGAGGGAPAGSLLILGTINLETGEAELDYGFDLAGQSLAAALELFDPASPSPDFMLQAYDSAGLPAGTFPVTIDLVEGDEGAGDSGLVMGLLDLPAAAVRLDLAPTAVGPALASLSGGGLPPSVSLTQPAGGEMVAMADPLVIEWTATDPEGARTLAMIRYTPDDGATWLTLVDDYPSNRFTVAAADLPGGQGTCRVEVSASDGLRSASALSGLFSLEPKAPEAFIFFETKRGRNYEQPAAAVINPGEGIVFHGRAFDAEEGQLPGEQLFWQLTGPVQRGGPGEMFELAGLPPGFYQVDLLAFDSTQGTGQAQATLRVLPKFIETAGGSLRLDGLADDPGYEEDHAPLPLDYGPAGAAEVRLVHQAGRLMVAAAGLDPGTDPMEALVLLVDVDNSGGAAPMPGELRFQVEASGAARTWTADGTGWVEDEGTDGLEARVSSEGLTWTAEMSIEVARLGGWNNQTVRLALGHIRRPGGAPEVFWPAGASLTAPDTWGTAVLGTAGVEFQDGLNGYAGTQDTDVRASDPDTSFGDQPEVWIDSNFGNPGGPAQGLLRFDGLIGAAAGQVPPGARIDSATLTLSSTRNNADSPNTIALHRLLVDWNEASTWNSLGDGIQLDGLEALAKPEATFVPDFPNPGGSNTQSRVIDVTASVQDWANGAPNFGWVLVSDGPNTYVFDASEHSQPANRPRLTVRYQAVPGEPPPPPPVLVCPQNLNVECAGPNGTPVDYPVQALNFCSPNVIVECDPPSGSFFPVGVTTVTCTAWDDCGQTNTCSFTVTVRDTTPPQLVCPSNLVVTAASAAGAVVSWSPNVFDACDPAGVTLFSLPPSGSLLPIGDTAVTCVARDAAGNETRCAFTVTVVPPLPPFFKVTLSHPEIYTARFVVQGGTSNIWWIDGVDAPGGEIYWTPAAGVRLDVSTFPAGPMTFPSDAGALRDFFIRADIDPSTSSDLIWLGYDPRQVQWREGNSTLSSLNHVLADSASPYLQVPVTSPNIAWSGISYTATVNNQRVLAPGWTLVVEELRTLVLQDGAGAYAGTRDTELLEAAPDADRGAQASARAGLAAGPQTTAEQGLLWFDGLVGTTPGQVPPGASVCFAELTLGSSMPGANSAQPVSLHRMLRPWTEADTWNTLSGGVSADDTEARSTPDARFTPNFPDPANNGPQSAAIDVTGSVQAWADGAPNHGWALLLADPDGYAFDTAEAADPARRPRLVVHYGVAPPVYAFGLAHHALGGAMIAAQPKGGLQVTSAGQAGSDGVRVELGQAEGWQATLEPLVLGAAGAGLRTTSLEWRQGAPAVLGVELLSFDSGSPQLTADYSGGNIGSLWLSIRDEAGVELSRLSLSNNVPIDLSSLLPAGCALPPELEARGIEPGASAWRLRWRSCSPDNGTLTRTLVVGHAPRLSAPPLAAVELTLENLPGLTLTSEQARALGNWHQAAGQTRFDLPGHALSLLELNGNGPDGVDLAFTGAAPWPLPLSPPLVRNAELTWLAPQVGPAAWLRAEFSGLISVNGGNAQSVSLGLAQWQRNGNTLEGWADASALGAAGVRVEALNGGVLLAAFTRNNGEWLTRPVQWPDRVAWLAATDAGLDRPPVQQFGWPAPVLMELPDGQQVQADRLRVQPNLSGLTLQDVSAASLRLGGWPAFTIVSERLNAAAGEVEPPPPRTYEAWVAQLWPPGTPASITGRQSDPDQDNITNEREYAHALDPMTPDAAGLPQPVLVEQDGRRRFVLRLRLSPWATDLELRAWGTGSLDPPVHWTPLNVVPLSHGGPHPPGGGLVDLLIPDVFEDLLEAAHRFIRVDIGTRPPPVASGTGESMRIGSYNVQFLSDVAYLDFKDIPDFSRPAFCCDDIPDRATIIARRIRATGYDVVAISEAFTSDAKRDLIAELEGDYPHYVQLIRGNSVVADALDFLTSGAERLCDGLTLSDLVALFPDTDLDFWESVLDEVSPGADPTAPGVCALVERVGSLLSPIRKQDSGLMLFSRFPFEPLPPEAAPFRLPPDGLTAVSAGLPFADVAGVIFADAKGPDKFATKGAGWVRVRKPGSAYVHNVVFTHLQANKKHDGVRASQLAQIQDMLLTVLGPRLDNEYVWLLGDLNINGNFTLPEIGDPDDDTPNRAEWASHFNRAGEFFTDILHDVWERQCNLPWLRPMPPDRPDFRDRGLTGGIDRSGEDDDAMRRIDYLLMNEPASPPANLPLAVQHLAVAYGLKAFGEEEPVAFGMAGRVNLSDHYGLIADINVLESNCQPALAFIPESDHGAFSNMPAHVPLAIRRPGGMQWVRFDTPGTYTITTPPGTEVQVYASTDISIPVRPLPGETRVLRDLNATYTGSIFDVPHTPLFVRVRGNLAPVFTGPVDLVVRRHQGAGPNDAIGLAPNDDSPREESFTPETVGPLQVWYRLDLEQADSGRPQLVCFFVQSLEGPANYQLDLFADPAAPSIFHAEGTGRIEFCRPETGGRRLYFVVTRPEVTVGAVRYQVGYSTDLTVLHGYVSTQKSTNCGPENFEPFILCKEQSDKPDRIFGINFQDDDLVRLSLRVEQASDGAELFARPPVLLKRNWDSGKSWPRFERDGEDGRFPIVRFLPDERLVVTLIEDDTIPDGLFETARAIGRLEGVTGDDDFITGAIDPLPREQFMTCPERAVRLEDRGPAGRVRARYDFRFHLSHGVPPGYRH